MMPTFQSIRSLLCGLTMAWGLPTGPVSARAADWPRWLGPNGDNIAPADNFETDLDKWKIAWKANVGLGYSAVAVAGDRAFTLGHEGGKETVFCFEAATGNILWKFTYPAELLARMHPGGPNATPTIAGNRVITVSKDGQVFCLSADHGTKLWQASLTEAMGVKIPQWGFASSAVVDGDRILFSGGKVGALELATGKPLWTSKNEYHPGYATVVVFKQGGKQFIAALDGKGFCVLDGQNGDEIARHPFKAMFDMTASTPIALAGGTKILISGNASSELLGFDGKKLSPLWSSTEIKNAMNNSIIADGIIYGIDGKQDNAQSRLVAVNLEDGKIRWARENFGYGSSIGVGGNLLALTENGELVAIKAAKPGYSEFSRRQILGKVCWTSPVYAGQRIFARNDRGDVICLSTN